MILLLDVSFSRPSLVCPSNGTTPRPVIYLSKHQRTPPAASYVLWGPITSDLNTLFPLQKAWLICMTATFFSPSPHTVYWVFCRVLFDFTEFRAFPVSSSPLFFPSSRRRKLAPLRPEWQSRWSGEENGWIILSSRISVLGLAYAPIFCLSNLIMISSFPCLKEVVNGHHPWCGVCWQWRFIYETKPVSVLVAASPGWRRWVSSSEQSYRLFLPRARKFVRPPVWLACWC